MFDQAASDPNVTWIALLKMFARQDLMRTFDRALHTYFHQYVTSSPSAQQNRRSSGAFAAGMSSDFYAALTLTNASR
jgi:hypothetical protein